MPQAIVIVRTSIALKPNQHKEDDNLPQNVPRTTKLQNMLGFAFPMAAFRLVADRELGHGEQKVPTNSVAKIASFSVNIQNTTLIKNYRKVFIILQQQNSYFLLTFQNNNDRKYTLERLCAALVAQPQTHCTAKLELSKPCRKSEV